MSTPIQVNQYFGNKNDSLKFGCKTLFLLTITILIIGVIRQKQLYPSYFEIGNLLAFKLFKSTIL